MQTLSKEQIYSIYEKHVAVNYTKEYLNKYVPMPWYLNKWKWQWKDKDFPRVIASLEFFEMMADNIYFRNVLTFDGSVDPELEFLNCDFVTNLQYGVDEGYDLHTLNLAKKDYDFAMCNQTIEHLYDPIRCLKNIYDHLKVGGMFYANVPVNNIPHSTPYHFYTGITPVGLGCMVTLAGFDILKIGQWGNREYLIKSYESLWPDYTYSDNPGKNEIDCPIITWVLAIKNK
jgi:SAM-dependent methyltransferase